MSKERMITEHDAKLINNILGVYAAKKNRLTWHLYRKDGSRLSRYSYWTQEQAMKSFYKGLYNQNNYVEQLMTTVEIIEELPEVYGSSIHSHIKDEEAKEYIYKVFFYDMNGEAIVGENGNTKIKAIYNTILSFAKWYESKQKKSDYDEDGYF